MMWREMDSEEKITYLRMYREVALKVLTKNFSGRRGSMMTACRVLVRLATGKYLARRQGGKEVRRQGGKEARRQGGKGHDLSKGWRG